MSDERTVTTDALETLGTIITENEKRDAIHLAVDNVVAGEKVYPGQDIEIYEGEAFHRSITGKFVGIVDPFLDEPVQKGEHFWLVVYPRTITSLRHVWVHPDFEDDDPLAEVSSKEDSEDWLRAFIDRSDCPDYETVIAKALNNDNSWDNEYLHFDGRDAHGDIPKEFYDHLAVVTGIVVPTDDRASHFSCSC